LSKFDTRVAQRETTNKKTEVQKEALAKPRSQSEKTAMARSQKDHLIGKLRKQGMSSDKAEKMARNAVERWDKTIRK